MSKASKWSRNANDAADALDIVKREKPESFTLCLSVQDRLHISVEDNGQPRIALADARIGYVMDTKPLLDMAHWILDTFGEAQP